MGLCGVNRRMKARAGCSQRRHRDRGWISGCGPGLRGCWVPKGNSTSLVGTAEQVAEALVDYYDLGITTFLIRGFDPLNDAIDYGKRLIPLTRQLIAEREQANRSGVSQNTAKPMWEGRLR